MKEAFATEAELKPGGGGIFDVEVDGRLVYSKFQEQDRFPTAGEVVARIRAAGR